MNTFQKLLTQIVKDDLKKPAVSGSGANFKELKSFARMAVKGMPITKIRDLKNWNKKLSI